MRPLESRGCRTHSVSSTTTCRNRGSRANVYRHGGNASKGRRTVDATHARDTRTAAPRAPQPLRRSSRRSPVRVDRAGKKQNSGRTIGVIQRLDDMASVSTPDSCSVSMVRIETSQTDGRLAVTSGLNRRVQNPDACIGTQIACGDAHARLRWNWTFKKPERPSEPGVTRASGRYDWATGVLPRGNI